MGRFAQEGMKWGKEGNKGEDGEERGKVGRRRENGG